jgi:hypothetical protein
MIDTRIIKHDDYSVEFKIGFYTSPKEIDQNKFKINTWIFFPNALDVNRYTYHKNEFYSDIKSNVRLITPIYTLKEILNEGRGPFPRLRKAIDILKKESSDEQRESYTYQIKMLLCIVKSALRRTTGKITRKERSEKELVELIKDFMTDVNKITQRFRTMRDEVLEDCSFPHKLKEFMLFGDEYLATIMARSIFYLMEQYYNHPAYTTIKPIMYDYIIKENNNSKQMGYELPNENDNEKNSWIVRHLVRLKKIMESDLYLHRIRKTDGAFVKEIYYGIAAGLAMIFATIISFIATQHYGNFTSALFLALVISYIFKDRIKESARIYFSSRLDQKYFDYKWDMSIRNQKIGNIREAFDFIAQEKVPQSIMELRNQSSLVVEETKSYDEKVILYRKRATLFKSDLEKYKEYHLSGINDILRFNLLRYTKQMDNEVVPLYLPDEENGFRTIAGQRVYLIYFILEGKSEDESFIKKYCVYLNRSGIQSIEEQG